MAAVTIYSDFGAQENSLSLLPLPPFYFPWSNGNRCCDLRFLNVELEASFFILPLYPYQEALLFLLAFYHGYNLQYPRLLIFLPAIWISACDSSSLTFHMFSAYKLNKQGDSIQSCCIPFQILNIVNVSSENTHTHTHTHTQTWVRCFLQCIPRRRQIWIWAETFWLCGWYLTMVPELSAQMSGAPWWPGSMVHAYVLNCFSHAILWVGSFKILRETQ